MNIKPFLNIGRFISVFFYSAFFMDVWMEWAGGISLVNFNRRIISAATLAGIDVSARVSLYYKAVIVGLLTAIITMYLLVWGFQLLQRFTKNAKGNQFSFEIKLFDLLSFLGIITIVFGNFGPNWKTTLSFVFCFQLLVILLSIWKSIALNKRWDNISKLLSNRHFIIWQFLNSFVFMFYLNYLGKIMHLNLNLNLNYQGIVTYVMGFIINSIIIYGLFYLFFNKKNKSTALFSRVIVLSCIPILVTPMYIPLANEMYLILNQRNLFFISPKEILSLLLLISVIAAIFIFHNGIKNGFKGKIRISVGKLLSNLHYPLFIIMLAMILYQPAVKAGPPNELFESGNPGIAVDQLFRYGKIPLLETFNAHAFSEIIGPTIYSLFNGYQGGANILYSDLINKLIYLILVYFFLRKLISSELTFITILLLPFSVLSIIPEYFIFAVLAVFVLNLIIKNASFRNYLLFWFVLILTFVWRFDLGSSAIISALGVYAVYLLIYRVKWNFKNFVLTGAITGIFWFVAFILLAMIKDVPILFRLKELISIVSSNQIWGYTTLGGSTKLQFYLYYVVVPVLNVGILVFILVKSKFFKKIKPNVFISILFLVGFTSLNFPRGLVRHSLVENSVGIIVGFLALQLIYLPFLIWEKRSLYENYLKFIMISVMYSFLFLSSGTGLSNLDTSFLGKAIVQFSAIYDYEKTNTRIKRYEESEQYQENTYGSLKNLFDVTMKPNETFIDFSDTPYMYVFTQRETPMYINQTPAFLSDETSQSSFLKEIESFSVPYVLFPDKMGWKELDGVSNNIRSYRVAEYIYNHYEPFIKMNGLAVWVRNDRKVEIGSKLAELDAKVQQVMSLYKAEEQNKPSFNSFDLKVDASFKDGLKLITGASDPQLFGVFPSIQKNEFVLDNSNKHFLQMEFTSHVGGKLQVYYLLKDQSFSEQNSVIVDLGSPGIQQKVNIPIPFSGVLKDIRIDPPSKDIFIIRSLGLMKKSDNYIEHEPYQFTQVDEDDVAWLPLYWGEKDALHAIDQTQVLVAPVLDTTLSKGKIKFSLNNIFDKSRGNYVHIKIKSKEIGVPYKVALEYGELINSNDSITGRYIFNVIADGQYHDYLIRVSSQYNWYRSNIRFLNISSEAKVDITNVEIKQGD